MTRRLFLLMALVVGLFGLASMGNSFTGDVWSNVSFELDPVVILDMDAGCSLLVEIGPLMIASESILDEAQGWLWQEFSAYGTLGAFDLRIDTLFGPSTGDFLYTQVISSIRFAGVEMGVHGAQLSDAVLGGPADGLALVLQGTAFGLDITCISEFGARVADADSDGISIVHAATGEERCYLVDPVVAGQGFTGQKVSVGGFTIGCLDDVSAVLYFGCDGFEYITFNVSEIDLGLPWIAVGVDLVFEVQTKSLDTTPELVFASSVCITPYLSLEPSLGGSTLSIEGISLNGLEIAYSWNGVTVRDITVLDTARYAITTEDHGTLFIARQDATSNGYAYHPDYWEMLGIGMERSGCCGGTYRFVVNNYFEHDSDQLFGWAMTYAGMEIPLARNVSVSSSMAITADGIDQFNLGISLSW